MAAIDSTQRVAAHAAHLLPHLEAVAQQFEDRPQTVVRRAFPTSPSRPRKRAIVGPRVGAPGLNYLATRWPIDELMKLYLTETAPEHYVFEPGETRIEIRGARGEFHINRIEAGAFAFRIAIFAGESIGAGFS